MTMIVQVACYIKDAYDMVHYTCAVRGPNMDGFIMGRSVFHNQSIKEQLR